MKRIRHKRNGIRAACATWAAVLLFLACIHAPSGGAFSMFRAFGVLPSAALESVDAQALPYTLSTARPITSAKGSILMEASTGAILCAENADDRLSMASTTKIMTALVALRSLPIDTPVTITREAVGIEGSSIYLCEGEVLTLEDLLYALLLESANDAAVAIAIAVAGDVPTFAGLMNRVAEELGLTQTHFVNPHGLDDPEHYTTARELAIITRAALALPDFRRICRTRRHTIPLHGEDGIRLLLNHNRLLSAYEGCIGVKTGYTKRTGRCLVSAAERNGVTLIAVTLGAPDDWRDHTALLDYGFERYESVLLCEPGFYMAPMPLVAGTAEYVMVENTDSLSVVLPRSHGAITCVVERPRFDYAPVQSGDMIGRLVFYETQSDGTRTPVGEVPLTAAYSVEVVTYKRTFRERLRSFFRLD